MKKYSAAGQIAFTVLGLFACVRMCHPQAAKPLLLRLPAISRNQIVFEYAGDLWSVGRDGGEAKRLTTGVGVETDPHFSPDGTQVAFTGEYDGNTDVYIMPASGGIPKRLTYHPGSDSVVGWTPDGKRILFVSDRDAATPVPRLYTISKDGGQAEPLPLPTGVAASYNAAGTHLAYVPTVHWQRARKRYHGGQTSPIWITALSTSHVEKVPRKIHLGNPPSFFYDPVWSPDSKKIAYTDKRLNFWYVDIDHGTPVKIDTDVYKTNRVKPT